MKKLFLLLLVGLHGGAFAQQLPAFKLLRYEEDYSRFSADFSRHWYEHIKKLPFSAASQSYLSIGGEQRLQYFSSTNEGWGDINRGRDGYLLSRTLLHADVHAGTHFRTFIQLQSSLAASRADVSPVESNAVDLHQALLEYRRDSIFSVMLGRQELSYGSQRLVSVREVPNNRQAFDAIRLKVLLPATRVDLFYSHYVHSRTGVFNDRLQGDAKFWGGYLVQNRVPMLSNIDIYYMGLYRRRAVFSDALGAERRHTIGTRIWKTEGPWHYDSEFVGQFGGVSQQTIRAWTASINTTYQFTALSWKPEIGLKTEWISGDKTPGDRLVQTFNPLFPKGAYFGLAALIGPYNLIDLHPSVAFEISQALTIEMDYDYFWRSELRDGLYAVNGELIYPGDRSDARAIGGQLTVSAYYQYGRYLTIKGEVTDFKPSGFLKESGAGKRIFFAGITTQLRF